jgi:hypothetical protein
MDKAGRVERSPQPAIWPFRRTEPTGSRRVRGLSQFTALTPPLPQGVPLFSITFWVLNEAFCHLPGLEIRNVKMITSNHWAAR